jgi:hypothetical protein
VGSVHGSWRAAASFAPCEVIIKNRLAQLAAPTVLLGSVLLLPGAALAATGGEPASADQPGCTFSAGTTTCASTTEIPGTPSTVTAPGSWTSTAGPVYDFESTTNIPDCDATPRPNPSTTTTTTSTLVTVTTAHRGAPGSHGKDLGTTTSSTPGAPVVTTIGKTSPGAATVQGSSVTATYAGLLPNTQYVTGARCYLGVAGAYFTSSATGAGTATFDLSGLRGRTIQLELAPTGEGFFGANYALTAPLTVQ